MSLRGVTNAKRKHGLALLAFNIRKITELSANQFNNNRKIDNFYIFTVKLSILFSLKSNILDT